MGIIGDAFDIIGQSVNAAQTNGSTHPFTNPQSGVDNVRNPPSLTRATSIRSDGDPIAASARMLAQEQAGHYGPQLSNGPWNAIVMESFSAEDPRRPPNTKVNTNQRPVPWIIAYIPSDPCAGNSPHSLLPSPLDYRRDGTKEEQRIHWQSIKHLYQIGVFIRQDGDPQGHVPQQNDRVRVTFYNSRNPGLGGHYDSVAHSGYQSPTALPALPDCETEILQMTTPSDASGNQSYRPRATSPISRAPNGIPRYVYGVDLAGHQDDQLSNREDFRTLSETNSFAIIKQSQGSSFGEDRYVSSYNPDWATWAAEAGMIVGYYHYATMGPYGTRENDINAWIADGRAEAQNFINAISRGHPGHLPWAIDLEGGSQRTGNPEMSFGGHYDVPSESREYPDNVASNLQSHARAYMQAFVDTLIQGGSPGGQVLYYGNPNKWERRFFGTALEHPDFWNYLSSRGQIWSARYGVAGKENDQGLVSYNGVIPANAPTGDPSSRRNNRAQIYRECGWDAVPTNWSIWQFTSGYQFGGGDTDRNIARTDYLLSVGVDPGRLIHSADADIEAGDGERTGGRNIITDTLLFT